MIMYKNVVLTVEECFSMLLDDRLNVEQYQVFAHFTRLGYILRPFVETYVFYITYTSHHQQAVRVRV